MSISRFQPSFDELVGAASDLATQLIYLRDTPDPVPYSVLERIQESIRRCRVQAYLARAEAAKAETTAVNYMTSVNGPTSLAAFDTLLLSVESAGTAYNNRVVDFVAALVVSDLYQVIQITDGGIDTRHLLRPINAPQAAINTLRQTQELADFIAALEALGI